MGKSNKERGRKGTSIKINCARTTAASCCIKLNIPGDAKSHSGVPVQIEINIVQLTLLRLQRFLVCHTQHYIILARETFLCAVYFSSMAFAVVRLVDLLTNLLLLIGHINRFIEGYPRNQWATLSHIVKGAWHGGRNPNC
jgi:hypothetical protein